MHVFEELQRMQIKSMQYISYHPHRELDILEFTIDGDSSSDGSQTFTLSHTYSFRTLRLKHVIYSIGNDSLYQSWSSSTPGVSSPSSLCPVSHLYHRRDTLSAPQKQKHLLHEPD
eukprot:COSAG02_NODE_3301_length_6982_cov_81.442685_2_plen_115_part_00